MRQIYGLAGALMAAAMLEPHIRMERMEEPVQPKPRTPIGPIIDTTRETKREKRRRLADLSTPTSQPFKDINGNAVTAGDTIVFSYGIPPVRVEAKLEDSDGEVWAMTPGHKPDRCKLKDLRKHVGEYYKLNLPLEHADDPSAKWDSRASQPTT